MIKAEKERIELFVALRALTIAHRLAMSDQSGLLVHDSLDLAKAERLLAAIDVSAAEAMSVYV